MNSDFPRIITLLRKERKLSQKQVSYELGISQSLLSHYEKGVRECGLDFVIKCADYYDVSCDYLLGRTPDKTGARLTFDDIPDESVYGKENKFTGSLLPILNKRLILNSLNMIFSLLQKINCKELTNEMSTYLMASIYKSFRIIYSVNTKNPKDMFSIQQEMYGAFIEVLQTICETNCNCVVSEKIIEGFEKLKPEQRINLSPNIITSEYPSFAPSLYNIIQNIELKASVKKMFRSETKKKDIS